MNRRYATVGVLLIALAFDQAWSWATEGSRAASLRDDARLARRVSTRRAALYLGELLDAVERQTGVPLRVARDSEPGSGVCLAAHYSDLPAHEVLDAVRILLTGPVQRWSWVRAAGSSPQRGWVLRSTHSFEEAARLTEQTLIDAWLRDVAYVRETMAAPEPQRTRRIRARPDLFHNGVNMDLAQLLTGVDAGSLQRLGSGAEVGVDPAALGSAGQAALDRLLRERSRFGRSTRRPATGFSLRWSDDHTGPRLMGRVHGMSQSVMGGPHWDNQWERRTGGGWKNYSDPEVQRLMGPGSGAAFSSPSRPLTGDGFAQLNSPGKSVNILIDPVAGADAASKLEFQSGRSGREAALLVALQNRLHWRDRGSFLLMRAAFASRHPRRHLLPWKTIRSLRAAADAASGYLRPADLAAASKWRPEQRGDQSREFPDLEYSAYRRWLAVWSLYSELSNADRAAIASRQGLSWQAVAGPLAARFAEQAAREKSLGGQVLQAETRRARVSLQVETSREGRRLVWRVLVDGREVERLERRLARRRPIEEL